VQNGQQVVRGYAVVGRYSVGTGMVKKRGGWFRVQRVFRLEVGWRERVIGGLGITVGPGLLSIQVGMGGGIGLSGCSREGEVDPLTSGVSVLHRLPLLCHGKD
jgi:hypothetical protein